MIQIRGIVYTKSDYETLKRLLVLGTIAFNCTEQLCDACPQKRLCEDVSNVIEYCDTKLKEMGVK